MPTAWTKPETALVHNGVTIYHVYRNDELGDPRECWYGYSEDCNDSGNDSFDIRDLPNYNSGKTHDDILKEAIEKGHLGQEGVRKAESI